MNLQQLYQRYPKIDQIVSLANENREHSPEIAKICDFVAGLCADLSEYLPVAPPAPVARFDPFTGQPLAPAAPPAPVARFDPFTGQPLAPVTPPAPVARFDPFTGQPLAPESEPAPTQWTQPPVGTPGLSPGWPQPSAPV